MVCDLTGKDVFFLWDTYGFPIDITRDVAQENDMTVDEAGFVVALDEQKAKSRAGVSDKVAPDVAVYAELLNGLKEEGIVEESGVVHLIYENLDEVDTTVAGLAAPSASVRD